MTMPMPSDEEIIALADDFRPGNSMDDPSFCYLDDGKLWPSVREDGDMTPGVIAFAHRLLKRFGACVPEPIAFADRKPEGLKECYLAWPWHKDPTVWVWRLGGPGITATHWLPINTPCLPTRRVVT